MKIAFLGTGILGAPMAHKLLEHQHELFVYNRTIKKTESLKKAGAKICNKPSEAIKASEIVILVLSDANAIEQVLFQDEKALINKTVIQMGTISSAQSIYFQKRCHGLKADYFECPVLGSKNEAQAAQLILMTGASKEQFNQHKTLLGCFGPNPRLIGPVGSAATLKLALNQLIAAHATCFSLSLALVRNNNIDVDTFMSVLNESSLTAPMYSKKLPNWVNHDYENPNFPLKHLIKDAELILAEASKVHLNTEVLGAIRDVLHQAQKEGLAEKDYSAVYEAINKK